LKKTYSCTININKYVGIYIMHRKHCWPKKIRSPVDLMRWRLPATGHWCSKVLYYYDSTCSTRRAAAGETDTPVGLARDRPSSPSPRHRVTARHCRRRRRRRRVAASGRLSRSQHDWPKDGHGAWLGTWLIFFLCVFRVLLVPSHSRTRTITSVISVHCVSPFSASLFFLLFLSLIIVVTYYYYFLYHYYFVITIFSLSTLNIDIIILAVHPVCVRVLESGY